MTDSTARNITQNTADTQQLLREAREGDSSARRYINTVAAPYIEFQNDRFCRRFCQGSFRNTRCTLKPAQGPSPQNSALCDKANAGYAWMLDELTNDARLAKIEAKSEAQLATYFKTMVNSLPFYERWKNWRFERRVHVPQYIADIDAHAKLVFLSLRSENNLKLIAQKHGVSENKVRDICDRIVCELTKRKRLHLLNPSRTVSLSQNAFSDEDNDEGNETELEDTQYSPEKLLESQQLKSAWESLDEVEQFVIEALVIEKQDANIVLQTLAVHKLPLGKNANYEKNDRQQLYYFKRKTLEKLQKLMTKDK